MSAMIAIADFGTGNLHSVVGAFRRAAPGARVVLADDAETLARADKVILPGDGHFDACMRLINERGMVEVLLSAAATKPFWGICAGMQMLYQGSDEGKLPGLGIFAGRIKKLPGKLPQQAQRGKGGEDEKDAEYANDANDASAGGLQPCTESATVKVPHIGWNTTTITKPDLPMLRGVKSGARFYFIHSYYAAEDDNTAATTTHGATITAISANKNIFATQFHPEKSATPGETLIKNFIKL